MDNTTQDQNPTQPLPQNTPPTQQVSSSFPQAGQMPPQQPAQPTQSMPVQPAINPTPQSVIQSNQSSTTGSVQQPPIQQQPFGQTQAQPQEQSSSPRITLDDLYGPSGFAENTTSAVPQHPMQPTQIPAQQAQQPVVPPVAPPVQNQQEQPRAVPPVQNIQSTQPAPVQPVVPPTSAPIPDLPTVPTAPEQQNQPLQQESQQPAPEEPAHEESIQPNLPLRKQVITEKVASANQFAAQAESLSDKKPAADMSSDNDSKPKGGVNKLLILRLLFGGVGALIAIILLFFVVTWLSSVFHPVSSGKVTLTYWGLWEDSNTMQSVISEFERQNPNITVQYEKEDPKQYSQRLLTRIQQGNGPDIFTYHSSWLPMVQSVLVPLPTSVVSKDDLENHFYPVVRTDLVKNGALYGIPMEVDTLSLFINNTLFKAQKAEVPTTWDSFGSTARALTQKDGNGKITVAGAALGTFDNVTHAPDILSALFVQNGVDITIMSPKSNASDALSFYTSFATGDSKVWDNTLDPSQLAFIKGNLAMYFGYSWDIFAIKSANPNLDFSVYPIPHLPGRNTTVASYWVQGVSAKSQHQKEALLFMQFLAQKNTEATLYAEESKTRLFGEPYARSDLGVTLRSNPLVYPFVSQATEATSSFFAGETQDTGLNAQMNGYLGNAVRSVLNNTSADSAIDTLTQGVQQIENQYGPSK